MSLPRILFPTVLACTAGILPATFPQATAQSPTPTFSVLYTFGSDDSHGKQSGKNLLKGSDGNFYGVMEQGGAHNNGTVFKITPDGVLSTLHDFSALTETDAFYVNGDGASPLGGLIEGADGNFYGVTSEGGAGRGGVFKITLSGVLTLLHSFEASTAYYTNTEGDNPGPLVSGLDGNFYGTNANGGAHGNGTVYKITPDGVLTVLYDFSANTSYTIDGAQINNDGVKVCGLTLGKDGNFYGTATYGGANTDGTVFRVSPNGAFTLLYTFSGSDGKYPAATLTAASDGNLYGTTAYGGTGGSGTVFRLTTGGELTVIHQLSVGSGINSDGMQPSAPLLEGFDDNLYGTASSGGTYGSGTLFEVTLDGIFRTLYSFSILPSSDSGGNSGSVTLLAHAKEASADSNAAGASPETSLVQDGHGSFYGITASGGANLEGTVFKLALTPAFFSGQADVSDGVYYLAFPSGRFFGYYSYLTDPAYLYHFDLGYEYAFDAADGNRGVYLYDFLSSDFFYTSPGFPFPYLYDFGLDSVVYYYPDPNNAGRYNTNGVRYFYVFNTGKIVSK